MILYHICKRQDVGNLKVGYIGVTENFDWRKKQHYKYSHSNQYLQKCIKKYDTVMYCVAEADKISILEMEKWLRPTPVVGWNIVEGGGLPPNASGRKWTNLQYENVPQRGSKNKMWKGYWVIDEVRYESLSLASKAIGCAKRTVFNRTHNPDFPNYKFEERKR